jgi:predicted ArsR family transcriptional regulator
MPISPGKSVTMSDATISAAGLRIIRQLVGNPPLTISDLIRATGVTRTAITEQLNELVRSGFVEQSAERLPGRGRPRHLYKTTNAALTTLFPSYQWLIVPAIWQAISDLGNGDLTAKVQKKVSRNLAEHYNRKVTAKKPEERLRQLMKILTDEGGVMEVTEEDGRIVAYKRSCPFISMVDEDRIVCNIDVDMMSQVVGRPVRRTACRHEGDACCKVEVVPEK